jgi:hypothetical protein
MGEEIMLQPTSETIEAAIREILAHKPGGPVGYSETKAQSQDREMPSAAWDERMSRIYARGCAICEVERWLRSVWTALRLIGRGTGLRFSRSGLLHKSFLLELKSLEPPAGLA